MLLLLLRHELPCARTSPVGDSNHDLIFNDGGCQGPGGSVLIRAFFFVRGRTSGRGFRWKGSDDFAASRYRPFRDQLAL